MLNDTLVAIVRFGAVALLAACTAAATAVGLHENENRAPACPAGYFAADVRNYGQRIEYGPDPVTHVNRYVITQNDWAPVRPDHRYVVSRECVRPLTNAENRELFEFGSTHPNG